MFHETSFIFNWKISCILGKNNFKKWKKKWKQWDEGLDYFLKRRSSVFILQLSFYLKFVLYSNFNLNGCGVQQEKQTNKPTNRKTIILPQCIAALHLSCNKTLTDHGCAKVSWSTIWVYMFSLDLHQFFFFFLSIMEAYVFSFYIAYVSWDLRITTEALVYLGFSYPGRDSNLVQHLLEFIL